MEMVKVYDKYHFTISKTRALAYAITLAFCFGVGFGLIAFGMGTLKSPIQGDCRDN